MVGKDPLAVHMLVDSLTHGGAELILVELAEAADEAGIDLTVGYLRDLDENPGVERLRAVGVEPSVVDIPPRLLSSAVLRVRRHLASVAPAIVHTHLGSSDILGGLAARSLGLPAVSTIHGTEFGTARGDRARHRLMALVRRTCAARVITVSEGGRRSYLATGWDTADRVVMIHNGIGGAPRPGAGVGIRAELGIAADAPLVVTLSKLRPEKCHELAIRAVVGLRRSLPGARLLVVGDGSERARLKREAAPLGDAVVFAGYRDDAMAVLDAADVLVHPSRAEAFPTTLLEAMAASVPAVATDVGGIPEIVEPGVTGVLVAASPDADELAAALERLLRDGPERRRMGEAARRRFERDFTARAWALRLHELYAAVLEERASGPTSRDLARARRRRRRA